MCKVSIVLPVYNAAKYIRATILSIQQQTHTDFECIFVDDGSTDDTKKIIESFQDHRFIYKGQKNSGGPSKPRNVGLENATGKYIFIFDADDIMLPTKLADSIAVLENNPAADILFTNFSSIDENGSALNGNYLAEYSRLWALLPNPPVVNTAYFVDAKELYAALIHTNFIGTSSVALRKSALSKTDVFNEDLKNSDDRLFWILFTKTHNAVFLNATLHQYRILPSGISNQDFSKRGPSKIKALEIIYHDCQDALLKKIIHDQIAANYIGLSYSCKLKKLKQQQRKYALKSMSYALSFNSCKLFIQSFL